MRLIAEPRIASLSDYHTAIDHMTGKMMAQPGVAAVYQLGGLTSPGISDLDMLVVFEDDAGCELNPRAHLPAMSDYLFTHGLFGTSRSHFIESARHTFFHNLRLLDGEHVVERDDIVVGDDAMKRQWAREFLVRMLVNMEVEHQFSTLNVRNLLLQGKALIYDLEFLNADDPEFSTLLETILDWRARWFDRRPADAEVKSLVREMRMRLQKFLDSDLTTKNFFLPHNSELRLGRNIFLHQGENVAIQRKGIRLPNLPLPARSVRKLIALQHRLNTFHLTVPHAAQSVPEAIATSFDYRQRVMLYNEEHLPFFMPLTSSLVLR